MKGSLRPVEAGRLRRRMGELCADEGNFAGAAEAWLSSTACFQRAADLEQARSLSASSKDWSATVKYRPSEADLHAAMQERESELDELEREVANFAMRCIPLQLSCAASKEGLNGL